MMGGKRLTREQRARCDLTLSLFDQSVYDMMFDLMRRRIEEAVDGAPGDGA